jgi:hypothetical protein
MKKTAEEIKKRIAEILAEVSMCWSEIPKGIFDSTNAVKLLNEVFVLMEEYRTQSELPSTDPNEDKENDSDYSNEKEDNFKRAWK